MSIPVLTRALAGLLVTTGSLGIFALMSIITLDVVLRNLGLSHMIGVSDYVALLLIVVSGLSIPAAFVWNSHLVVEIGTYGLSSRLKSALEAFWLLFAVPVIGTLTWLVLTEGIKDAGRGRVLGILGWSPLTFHTMVAVSLALTTLACLIVGWFKLTHRYNDLMQKD